jgi:hypothetical protein
MEEQPRMSTKAAEPTSEQQSPSPPSARVREQSLPFHVAIADGGLEISAKIRYERDLDNLVRVLQTMKPLLQNIYGREPNVIDDTPEPVEIEDHAQRVFAAPTTAHKDAETGISFIITKAQKSELRQRGYSEEQIREMKPEDAHRALGLIS